MSSVRLCVIAALTVFVIPAGTVRAAVSAPTRQGPSHKSPPVSGNPGPFVAPQLSATSTTTAIPVSGTAPGATFDGVGAISGGGGNSRYLIDYPQPARDAILDYLFKPSYGASLQVLKLEIGGDANSTDGSEASIEPSRGAIACDAGYEFWLAEQAKARNPAIKIYALAWTAPGWTGSFWSDANITYTVDWLACARQHGLTIDYLGANQNEATLDGTAHYDKSWTEKLRAAMNSAGFNGTKIVMADIFNSWAVADDLAGDPAFSAATDVVGVHDICGYPTNGNQCTSTATARNLGKPLWGSELGAMDGNSGAASMARAMVRGYPNARLVGYVHWPLVSAMPPFLPHQNQGLIYARQPWSGNYQVNAMTYSIAMMSWFTAPGWQYINGANGGFGATSAPYSNGSYTTLKSPDGNNWSTIAETTTTTANQTASFTISGLPATTVHVWRTNPNSTKPADWMVSLGDIRPLNQRFSFVLQPGYIYAFTTLGRGPKGASTPPAPADLGSYVEQPGRNPLDDAPVYLAPEDGAFRYEPCQTDPNSSCIQQLSPQPPVYWRAHPGFPYAVIGDPSLQDYTVSADVLLTQPGSSAGVINRFSSYDSNTGIGNFRGHILALDDTGTWRLYKNSRHVGVAVLASGTLPTAAGIGTWHRLALTIDGSTLTANIDGRTVGAAIDSDPNYVTGIAGIEAGASEANGAWTGSSWPIVQYRHLAITP